LKLYQYDDIKKLNQALGSFTKNNVPVIKVDVIRLSIDKIQYFVLADPKEVVTIPTTEDKVKETVKIKEGKKTSKIK
jgi:hypothetical protein